MQRFTSELYEIKKGRPAKGRPKFRVSSVDEGAGHIKQVTLDARTI